MTDSSFSKAFIEDKIRRKTFGVLSTVSPKGKAQSSGVLYGVSEKNSELKLYILTSIEYKKVQNIMKNPYVSFTITFPHYYFRMAPSSTIQFQAKARLLSANDPKAINSFEQKRVLRMMLKRDNFQDHQKEQEDLVFLELTPLKRYNCYGVGYSFLQLIKDVEDGFYQIEI